MKSNERIISMEEAEEREKERQEALQKLSGAANKIVEALNLAGYDAELEETGHEFIVKSGGIESHFLKGIAKFPRSDSKDGPASCSLEDLIAARVINPHGKLSEILASEEFIKFKERLKKTKNNKSGQ